MEGQTLSEASMDKPWVELKDSEKIERMRAIVKQSLNRVESLEESNRKLKEDLNNHDHLNGKIVKPISNLTGGLATLGRRLGGTMSQEDSKKVFF